MGLADCAPVEVGLRWARTGGNLSPSAVRDHGGP